MNNFIKSILSFALRNRFFIFFVTALLAVAGYISFKTISIDAFPDVTNTSVTIITQWPGRSAEEVEKFVTRPLEIAMNPAEKKNSIRSSSLFGLSVVKITFDDDVDYAAARLQINNHLRRCRFTRWRKPIGRAALWANRRDIPLYANQQQTIDQGT